MRHKLSAVNLQKIKNILSKRGAGKKLTTNLSIYFPSTQNVEKILLFFSKELNIAIEFEPHPLSPNGESGLKYVNPVVGYDNYSREWHIGSVESWKEAVQKTAFEDAWKRWIASDFIDAVEKRYGIVIKGSGDKTVIDKVERQCGVITKESDDREAMARELFDFACRQANYIQSFVKPEEENLFELRKIVDAITISALDDFIDYEIVNN
jgi:hypothetical protein